MSIIVTAASASVVEEHLDLEEAHECGREAWHRRLGNQRKRTVRIRAVSTMLLLCGLTCAWWALMGCGRLSRLVSPWRAAQDVAGTGVWVGAARAHAARAAGKQGLFLEKNADPL